VKNIYAASSDLFSCRANSGQIKCQSSGRRSLRVTWPFVACSITKHRSIGTDLMSYLYWLIKAGLIFSFRASEAAFSCQIKYSFSFIAETIAFANV